MNGECLFHLLKEAERRRELEIELEKLRAQPENGQNEKRS